MRVKPAIIGALALGIGVFVLASVSQAEWHSDPRLHYGFSVPDGWMAIPKSILDESSARRAKRLGVEAPHFEAGFQLRSEQYLTFPYLVVQHYPLDTGTVSQIESQISNSEESTAIKRLRNSELIKGISFGKPTADPVRKMVFYTAEMNVEGSGLVRTLNVIAPGRSGSVFLLFTCLDADYAQYLPSFQVIIDSFKFEKGYEYNWAARATKSWSFLWSGAGERAIMGTVKGALIAICVVPIVLWKRRDNKRRGGQA